MTNPPKGKPNELLVKPETLVVEKEALKGLEAVETELKIAEQKQDTEKPAVSSEQEKPSETVVPVTTPAVAPAPKFGSLDPIAEKIEDILEEDLTDLYLSLPQDKKALFKQKGEETVGKIRELLTSAKVNAKKIFELLRNWMKIIPGVNRFFLEQEAKIKTDKILFMNDQEKK